MMYALFLTKKNNVEIHLPYTLNTIVYKNQFKITFYTYKHKIHKFSNTFLFLDYVLLIRALLITNLFKHVFNFFLYRMLRLFH